MKSPVKSTNSNRALQAVLSIPKASLTHLSDEDQAEIDLVKGLGIAPASIGAWLIYNISGHRCGLLDRAIISACYYQGDTPLRKSPSLFERAPILE